MFTEHQINTMVRMQDEMNCLVHPQWRDQNFPYLRAARMEAMEAIDHYGWKFWKKQTPDMDQVELELVDIWSFLLSHLIIHCEKEGREIREFVCSEYATVSFIQLTEYFIKETLSDFDETDDITCYFFKMLSAIEMSHEELFRLYVVKNVLNKFRQDHGYKEGTYIKNWDGREDNEHLTEIMETLDLDHADVELNLRREIANRYQALSI